MAHAGQRRVFICVMAAMPLLALLGGCASVSVEGRKHAMAEKPDFIYVKDFAVKPDDVNIDQGMATTVALEAGLLNQTDEEVKLGRKASDTLTKKMVEVLREAGIPAYRSSDNVKPTRRTVIIAGRFVSVDAGNRTLRVSLGFGLGRTELRTRIAAYQDGKLIAQGDTATGSGSQPGVAVSLGAGAAAGAIGTSAASAGAGAAGNEMFMSNIEADASRTAQELANRIIEAYTRRGWIVEQKE